MPNVIKFDGVDGESQLTDHLNWSEIGPFSFSINHPYSGLGTGGSSGGKAEFPPITISKRIDKSSKTLMEKATFGFPFPKVEIKGLKTTGSNLESYVELVLNEVLIKNYGYNNGGDDAFGYMNETLVISFKKFEITHKPQTKEGVMGPAGTFGIDLEKYAEK